jgi:hypothetical protein
MTTFPPNPLSRKGGDYGSVAFATSGSWLAAPLGRPGGGSVMILHTEAWNFCEETST